MIKIASVHNAIGLLLDVYGQLLSAQEQENAALRAQVQNLTAQNQELARRLAAVLPGDPPQGPRGPCRTPEESRRVDEEQKLELARAKGMIP